MQNKYKQNLKGFTLLEILLVIAAIGILAAIVLIAVNPNKQINQVRQVAINSEKNVIEKALQQRLIDTGNYPAGLDGLQRRVCSNVVTIDCIDLSGLIPDYIAAIPESITYTVAKGNDGRVYVNLTETGATLTCPTGYIKVPGNSLYGTKDFCVMKYEAKDVSGVATSQINMTPWVNISQTDAISACNNAGADLISNNEWMTIARNIEAQPSNWVNESETAFSGGVGDGMLWRGHSDNDPVNALAASTDNDPYNGTENSGFSRERRTHTLSNGEIIWDLSGNVNEWINDTIMGVDKPNDILDPFFTEDTQEWSVFNTGGSYGSLRYDLLRPSNNEWSYTQNTGTYNPGDLTGGPFAAHRGGTCDSGGPSQNSYSDTGVFALDLSHIPAYISDGLSFRCVVR